MKKILLKTLGVLLCSILTGCSSLMQTGKLQEEIRQPKNYCQLKQAEKIEVTINDITKYDDSNCITFSDVNCIKLNTKIKGRKNEYLGYIEAPFVGRSGEVIVMPYPAADASCHTITDDICIMKTKDNYWVTQETYNPEPYNGLHYNKRVGVIRVIKKPKLTATARQELLNKKKYEIQQKYLVEQQKNERDFANCNEDYNKMLDFYQNSTSIKKFCNSVEYTWFSHYCLGTKDDNERCKTLADLFIDCYQQGAIKSNDSYVAMTFFNGLERGKVQFMTPQSK